ncbi:MAG: hypothetical protein ACD_9C00200G0012 [uncultured bacterium]|nr:MAG: hypothetical protein ACD_9C00200G0012 [uncultured bacterium]
MLKDKIKILKSFFEKASIYLKDHLHLLFKSAAVNHLRIQKLNPPAGGAQEGESCNLSFESFSDLKRYQKKVRLFTYSFSSTIFSVMIAIMILQVFFVPQGHGATYTFSQNSWLGGLTANTAAHSDDVTGWTEYQSKDGSVSADAEISLTPVSESLIKTTDEDFAVNGQSNTAVLSGSVKLLKLAGAACTVGAECTDNSCISNLCMPLCSASTACGSSCAYNADVYATVQIGSQCWFRENLRTTKYPNGTNITKGPVANLAAGWTDASTMYYSCPPNATNNGEDCAAAGGTAKLGMLYQWKTMMNGAASVSVAPGPQGICPSGWHVPVDTEVTALFNFYGGLTAAAATQLKTIAEDKFSATLPGQRREGYYELRASRITLAQATERAGLPTETWVYSIYSVASDPQRYATFKTTAFTVRCVKN